MKSLLLLIMCWASLPPPIESFNLAWKIPLIKTGGIDEGYFGFSVAQHRTPGGARGEPRILVGAPRDQNLQPGTNRSGALYQCPFTNAIEVGT